MRMRRCSLSHAKGVRVPCASTQSTRVHSHMVEADQEGAAMKFGIHNSSWVDSPDPSEAFEAFEAAKAKAQWAEDQGFVWSSVLDHLTRIPRVGAPRTSRSSKAGSCSPRWAAVTRRMRLATLATAVGYCNWPPLEDCGNCPIRGGIERLSCRSEQVLLIVVYDPTASGDGSTLSGSSASSSVSFAR